MASLLPVGRLLRGAQERTFSAEVNVVNVLATVRSRKGDIVRDLTKNDFQLEEDGRPQAIRYFSQETNLPLTLGLLVDTSPSQRRLVGEERQASYRFLDQVLDEKKDLAFLIHFERDVELLQDLTSSRRELRAALALLEAPQPQRVNRRNFPPPGGRPQGGTSLFDAVLLASDELMKKQAGRKALIVLSDGVDTASKVSMAEAIEAAQRADTLIYSILFFDEEAYRAPMRPGPGMGRRRGGYPQPMPTQAPNGKKILERLSKSSGGGFFEVSKKHPLEETYNRIQEELRSQYNLGYTPERRDGRPGYHKIRLTTNQKGLVVQAREGYYADR